MYDLDEKLKLAEEKMGKPSFRHDKGLGNEIGYYIFTYSPQEEMAVREWINYIEHKYESGYFGFRVLVFDIYDIAIDILQGKGFLEKCCEFEQKQGLERLSKAIGNTLRVTGSDNLLIKYIQDNTEDDSVVFLTGIGKCYPLLRSHTIINNLHQVLDHVPVVMFYPGKYDGQELILFDEIKDDNCYRASKLVD